jgi:hypothetical protein
VYSIEKELGMDVRAPVVFLRCFSDLKDPRRHNVRHLFADILAIAILAVMCRSDDWDEVVLYGRTQKRGTQKRDGSEFVL